MHRISGDDLERDDSTQILMNYAYTVSGNTTPDRLWRDFVTVRALTSASASKQGKPAPVTISYTDLVDPDSTDEDLA